MKTKKFLSMVLALAMIFTLGVSVFAAEDAPADPNKFEATAEVKIPSIDVTVPATAPLFINPMGFKVKVADGAAAGADDEEGVTDSKVVSPLFQIKNASPMKLDVGVIASAGTVTPASGTTATMSISATPIAEADTKNSVFIYADFGEVEGEDDEAKLKTDNAYDAEKAATLAITTKAPKDPTVVGTVEAGGDDPSVFGFQFKGDCNANAKNEWVAGEKVTVTLMFSFKPNMSASTGS